MLLANNHPQSSDSFESLRLCRNVHILVSFRPVGSEGFEVRSHFTPVFSVSSHFKLCLRYARQKIVYSVLPPFHICVLYMSPAGLEHFYFYFFILFCVRHSTFLNSIPELNGAAF